MKIWDIPFNTHHNAEYIQKNKKNIENIIYNEIKYNVRNDIKLQIPFTLTIVSYNNNNFTCELMINYPKKSYHLDIYNDPSDLFEIIKYTTYYI